MANEALKTEPAFQLGRLESAYDALSRYAREVCEAQAGVERQTRPRELALDREWLKKKIEDLQLHLDRFPSAEVVIGGAR